MCITFIFQEVAQKFSRKLMFTTKVLTGGHTKFKMMNPSFEEIDLLVASLGALSKLTTTGKYTVVYVEYGMSEGKLLEQQLEVTFNKINAMKDTCHLFSA
jgi:hypothetical protein